MSADPPSLTLPLAQQVFFATFYLSQGVRDQQYRLFNDLALRRPSWRFTEAIRVHLRSLSPSVQALIERGFHGGRAEVGAITSELDLMSHTMGTTLAMSDAERRQLDSSTLLANIARSWIAQDEHYLTRSGRPRSLEEGQPRVSHPRRDRYFSYVCHYLLLERRLGITVFDELLADAREALKRHQGATYDALMQGRNIREQLKAVIDVYNRYHPEAQVTYKIK